MTVGETTTLVSSLLITRKFAVCRFCKLFLEGNGVNALLVKTQSPPTWKLANAKEYAYIFMRSDVAGHRGWLRAVPSFPAVSKPERVFFLPKHVATRCCQFGTLSRGLCLSVATTQRTRLRCRERVARLWRNDGFKQPATRKSDLSGEFGLMLGSEGQRDTLKRGKPTLSPRDSWNSE